MSTRLATHDPQHHTDDGEEYVLIDPRAVLLDLPDEPRFESRPLRGSQPPAASAPCDPEVEWRTFLGAVRRTAVADETRAASAASAESMWHRLARRLQHAFSARAGKTPTP